MLESEITLIAEVVGSLDFPNDDNVLDTDSKLAIGVVAGLWRHLMSGQIRRIDISRTV